MVAWRTKEAKVALFPYSWIGLFWKEFPFTTIILISFSDAKTYHKLLHSFPSLPHSQLNTCCSPKYPSPPPLITFLFCPPVAPHMVKRSHNPKKIKTLGGVDSRRGFATCEIISDYKLTKAIFE